MSKIREEKFTKKIRQRKKNIAILKQKDYVCVGEQVHEGR
jgi:hypothetical protein